MVKNQSLTLNSFDEATRDVHNITTVVKNHQPRRKRQYYTVRKVVLDGETRWALYINGLRSWRHGVYRDRHVAGAELIRTVAQWPQGRVDAIHMKGIHAP